MAHRSKTQRAKASAARQQRKANRDTQALENTTADTAASAPEEKPRKLNLLRKSDDEVLKADKKAERRASKKSRFQFLRDVKAEMKRVTWPTKKDVLRWSGVVVVALLFFGVGVAVLDNLVVTPLLVLVSGLGA